MKCLVKKTLLAFLYSGVVLTDRCKNNFYANQAELL